MAPPDPSNYPSPTVLCASYKSTSESKSFTHAMMATFPVQPQSALDTLPQATADSDYTKKKTAYLSELRSSTKKLQEEINVFLTRKMEEEKAAASSGIKNQGGTAVDRAKEEKEEENYGEEIVEDDV